MKRFLAVLLAVLMFCGANVMIFTALARTDVGACGDGSSDLTWTLDTDTGVLTISGTGKMMDYSVETPAPWYFYYGKLTSVVIGDGVTSIGDHAFEYAEAMTEVTIGSGVTEIGKSAFCGCSRLETVEIPDSVTSIGEFAFSECGSITAVTLGSGVESIGTGAFLECSSLGAVILSDKVASIGNGAFYNCTSLAEVTVPISVTSIGDFAFSGCSGLKDIYYAGTQAQWSEIAISFENDELTSADIHCYEIPVDPPTVESVEKDGVGYRITFSQYMDIDSVNSDNVVFYAGDAVFGGTIAPINSVASEDDSSVYYASEFLFTPSSVSTQVISVNIGNVKNYAGVVIEETYTKQFPSGTVTFEDASGDTIDSQIFGTGAVITLPELPAPDGEHKPIGWFDGNMAYFANNDYTVSGDVTLKAIYSLIVEISSDGSCCFLNGELVPAYYGLVEWEGDFYYVKENSKIVRSRTCYINNTNGLVLPNGKPVQHTYYEFGADGKLMIKQGIKSDGKYYIDGVAVQSYYGLVEWDGDLYYIRDDAQVVRNQSCFVNTTNDLAFSDGEAVQRAYYEFDSEGKIIILKQGLYSNGKYYIDGEAVGSYYGLVQWKGDFYYIKDHAKIVKNKTCYVNTTNGLTFANGKEIPRGYYEFDADGKMIVKQGIQPNGKYYIDGEAVGSYYGLVLWKGDYYYIKDNAQIVRNKTCYVNSTNGLPITKGNYEFDADGKLIIKQGVWSDGRYYIDNEAVGSYYGLVKWNGDYYYIKDNAQIVRSKTCRVNTTNGLTFPDGTPIPSASFAFDADGKMIY